MLRNVLIIIVIMLVLVIIMSSLGGSLISAKTTETYVSSVMQEAPLHPSAFKNVLQETEHAAVVVPEKFENSFDKINMQTFNIEPFDDTKSYSQYGM